MERGGLEGCIGGAVDPADNCSDEAEFGAQRSDNELKCINLNNQHLSACNNSNNNTLQYAFGDNNNSNKLLACCTDHDLQKPATLEGSLSLSLSM